MAFINNMTALVNKIEIRLGTKALNLPPELQKDKWADIIKDQSLITFSRFFPRKITYTVKQSDKDKSGQFYLIDENRISPSAKILGVRDLKWDELTAESTGINNQPWGQYDLYPNDYDLDDFNIFQNRANQLSLFNNGWFVDFEYPNKLFVRNAAGTNIVSNIPEFKIEVFIVQPDSLTFISPTMMETFEALAQADVAVFLYEQLKYFDDLESVFGSTNLKLDLLGEKANRREEVLAEIKDNYIVAGNSDQPIMYSMG